MAGVALLRGYRLAWLRAGVIAGLTVGAMLVPQSMAYAELAGMPAAEGLYASLLAPVASALTGTSRHLGAVSVVGFVLVSSQLSAVTGVPVTADTFFPRVVEFLRGMDQLRPVTVLLGLSCLLLIRAFVTVRPPERSSPSGRPPASPHGSTCPREVNRSSVRSRPVCRRWVCRGRGYRFVDLDAYR